MTTIEEVQPRYPRGRRARGGSLAWSDDGPLIPLGRAWIRVEISDAEKSALEDCQARWDALQAQRTREQPALAAKRIWLELSEAYRKNPDPEALEQLTEYGPREKALAVKLRQKNRDLFMAQGRLVLDHCLPEIVNIFKRAFDRVLAEIENVEQIERAIPDRYNVAYEPSAILKSLVRLAEDLHNDHALYGAFLAKPPVEPLFQSPKQILRDLYP